MASTRYRKNRSNGRRRTRLGASTSTAIAERLTVFQRDKTQQQYLFRLFVTGTTRTSASAIERVRAACDKHLSKRYALEVIDIFQLPDLARKEHIVATPTLVRALPPPLRRYVGNMSNIEELLFGLDLARSPNDSTI